MKFSKIIFLIVFFLIHFKVNAVDVSYDGYFRSRGNFYYNLDLNRDQAPNGRAFTDFRFRLNPTFFITDKIRVKSSLNFLDSVLGGSSSRGGVYTNPAQANNRLIDPNEQELIIGHPVTNPETPYEGPYLPEGLLRSTGSDILRVRQAWLEVDVPVGVVKIGRMPHHFGLGIFANKGGDSQQDFESSRDRIAFETYLGSYYLEPGVGWLYEGFLDHASDDFFEYYFVFGKKSEKQDVGIYLSYNAQNRSIAPVATAQFNQVKTAYWAFDFYAQADFNLMNMSSEVVLLSGKAVGKDLLAVNAVLRTDWSVNKWKFSLEGGYSSGTTESDLKNNELRTFSFSPAYDVSLLLFEEALPGGPTVKNSKGATIVEATPPHTGALANAFYGRLHTTYAGFSLFKPSLNILIPFAVKKDLNAGGKFYGVEYDLAGEWPLDRYWSVGVQFGHFIPSSFYKNMTQEESALLLRGSVIAHF